MLCFVGSCVEELQECTVCVSFKMSSIEFGINIHSIFGSKEMITRNLYCSYDDITNLSSFLLILVAHCIDSLFR